MLKYYSFWGVHYMPAMQIGGKYTFVSIFLAQIGLGVWCLFVVINFLAEMNTLMEHLYGLNIFFHYIGSLLTFWLMVYDSFQYRNAQFEFWYIYSRINQQFCSQTNMKKCIYLSILIVLLCVDTTYLLLSLILSNKSSLSGKFMQYLFLNFVDNRKLFYLLHLKVLAFQLHKIELDLKHCENVSFAWMRRYYKLIYEMSDHVNTIFGWSQLSLILLSFHSLIRYSNASYRIMNIKSQFLNNGNYDEYFSLIFLFSLRIKNQLWYLSNFTEFLYIFIFILMIGRVLIHLFCLNFYTSKCYTLVRKYNNLKW